VARAKTGKGLFTRRREDRWEGGVLSIGRTSYLKPGAVGQHEFTRGRFRCYAASARAGGHVDERFDSAIPPRNGEGDHEVVEGAHSRAASDVGPLRQLLRSCHLPVPGRSGTSHMSSARQSSEARTQAAAPDESAGSAPLAASEETA